ncbi:MAG: hypothetical protein IPK93_04765 [Solirubrobacterales bacterium]|nr:hypothetical protein [Solirubrobacterales bacterium]
MNAARIFKAVVTFASGLIAIALFFVAFNCFAAFVHVDGRDGFGNFGYVLTGLFYLVLAGPFAAITFVLGRPLISNNPKYRPGSEL